MVVRNTLEGGRRAGYLTALGAALANTTIAIACGLGLSILLSVWPGSLDAIRIGLAINLLSPVIISFYLSVVPSFIPAGASRFYYSGLAATHVGLAIACHALWATALDAMRRWFVAPWKRRLLQAGTGFALLALAIGVLI